MEAVKKITVIVPKKLLHDAVKATGKGVTPTIREGLKLLSAHHVFEELRKMRGKVKFSIDYEKLRKEEE